VWQAHVKIFTAQKGKLLLAKKHEGALKFLSSGG